MRSYARRFRSEDLPEVLSMDLRQSDKDELKASVGLDPADAIVLSLAQSAESWVVVHDGKIEAVFGVSLPPNRLIAIPWFLGTDKIDEYGIAFLRQSRLVVREWLDRYQILMNYVDSRHTKSIAWLKWLGFTVDESEPYVFLDPDVPFYKFYMVKGGNEGV